MIADLGLGALLIAFLLTLYGSAAALWGVRRQENAWISSARAAMLLTFPVISVAAISLIISLVNLDFHLEYVARVTSRSMPLYLRITALWGGQAGSLLFWAWLMSAFASLVMLRDWRRDRVFLPWVILVCLVTLGFFLGLIIFFENPFQELWQGISGAVWAAISQPPGTTAYIPVDGNGLNPLLRHPGMIIHPPLLYLGFVSFVIPFAFAVAALITGRSDDRWIRLTRRWTLWAWLFLSLGLLLGSRWAYDVLGWGGYWGWDPVEIAAFMPWLTGTAFLHSVMIQEKRGLFRHWNMLLIILTYDLVIFGTFLTRSGVLSSVHAFAQSAVGPAFFIFITATLIASLYLLSQRWESLKSDVEMTSLLSRESFFLVNNLLFMGILVICFWGVVFPLVSEASGVIGRAIPALGHIFTGQKITVGPIFYERATGPLWAGLLLLMGIAPLSAWRASTARTLGRAIWKPFAVSLLALLALLISGMRLPGALLALWLCAFVFSVTLYEFWRGAQARRARGENFLQALWQLVGRNRRRYGGYIIHLGVVLIAVGIIGIEFFQRETQGQLAVGERLTLGEYSLEYESISEFDTGDGRRVDRAVVNVYNENGFQRQLFPRRDYYYESQQAMTIPGLYSTLEEDFYVLLVEWEPVSAESATFKIYLNPLVNWVWLGGLVFIGGTFVAAWPEADPAVVAKRAELKRQLAASARS
ncbi:MAG: heme lyase CcmF/NrfE family subunit [Chloroflexi bacterium]|nr:heme lyase CcmF/NrfE family subunit [Chloroflexota bacterium]